MNSCISGIEATLPVTKIPPGKPPEPIPMPHIQGKHAVGVVDRRKNWILHERFPEDDHFEVTRLKQNKRKAPFAKCKTPETVIPPLS